VPGSRETHTIPSRWWIHTPSLRRIDCNKTCEYRCERFSGREPRDLGQILQNLDLGELQRERGRGGGPSLSLPFLRATILGIEGEKIASAPVLVANFGPSCFGACG
jgi:hypothetical protein